MEWICGDYRLTDEAGELNANTVVELLQKTYWAQDRSRAAIEKSWKNSLCFSLFRGGEQVGFSRALTDYSTFTWICDVVVSPAHRGKGIGKWMIEQVLSHPALQTHSQVLRTRDAHGLYERFGFKREEYLRRNL